MYIIFNWQDDFTPFECAVEKERSKIVKYFVEEVKVDTTAYDEVTIIIIRNNLMLCLVIMYVMCKYIHDIYI